MSWIPQASGSMISVQMRAGLWQEVLFDLLKLKDLDDARIGSLVLIEELIDAIVDDESDARPS